MARTILDATTVESVPLDVYALLVGGTATPLGDGRIALDYPDPSPRVVLTGRCVGETEDGDIMVELDLPDEWGGEG